MRNELEELQDHELSLMNKLDLDRMTTLERQIPSFERKASSRTWETSDG